MPVFRHVGVHILAAAICCCTAFVGGQGTSEKPPWCQKLPRPEYSKLQRIPVADSWFEVYKVAPDVFAIYELHQFEETISYLILGRERALLFDTGMGIGDLKALTSNLTTLPVTVLNSHTNNDHVGDNWQFDAVYGMDTEFTRQNAKGSKADAQAEIAPGEICGALPAGFNPSAYATRPWHVTKWLHDGDSDLGGRTIEVIATPGARRGCLGRPRETTLQVTACDQFFDEQSRHDGLACSWVVGEQESYWLTREHRFVDGRDLVRQRLDEGCVHSKHWVEEMCQMDACASETRRNKCPSPSKLHGRPCSTTWRRGSSWR